MVRAALALCVVISSAAMASAASPGYASVSRGTRSFYGTNFGNRYQYFGQGYGYPAGTPGVGGGVGYGGYGGRYGGYGAYGRSNGMGGSGRYGGMAGGFAPDLQLEQLHEQRMMWSMKWAPIPQMPGTMTLNPMFNPYQSHLADDIYHRREPPPAAETYENPFVEHPSIRNAE